MVQYEPFGWPVQRCSNSAQGTTPLPRVNAAAVQARLVVEAANGPVTYGDEILRQRGIPVLPDLFVNVGRGTVSYFEWIRNLSHILGKLRGPKNDKPMFDLTASPLSPKRRCALSD